MNLSDVIRKVVDGISLKQDEAYAAMTLIMEGEATPAQIGSYITALRMKGESVPEIIGSAQAMREHATGIPIDPEGLVDTCGTGGDGAHTINVSTLSALVAAGAGVKVAKHGNRSVSSRCGSADVLSALGVNLQVTPETVSECIRQAGIGFLFAPLCHGAMKHAIGPRREIGIRTLFNILGPLCNPAAAGRQVLGVYDPELTEVLAKVLLGLGSTHVWVVHGSDGLDELTVTGKTRVTEMKNGEVKTFELHPTDVGISEAEAQALKGGEPEANARVIQHVLEGRKGACRDIAVLNAAAAILVSGKAPDLKDGVARAQDSLDSGKAQAALEKLIQVTNQAAPA